MISISTVAVVGAGTMGAGIAQTVAQAGLAARLHDADSAALSKGRERALAVIEAGLTRNKITAAQRDAACASLSIAVDLAEALSGADLIIEAVPERMDLKRDLFTRLSRFCPPSVILASNTSSLSITKIASCVAVPSRVVGLHFFNPPHLMKLVEIVRAEQTSDETVAAAKAFVARLGKEAILVRDSPGFATSRLGLALGLEAMRMLEQGVASAADIDRAMELGYGHPMGPLQVSDLVGLDVRLGIAEILEREVSQAFRPPTILRRLVRAGKLGKKSGEGFYHWDPSGKRRD